MGFAPFVVSAPGRLCLFGEHQDYLGLAVISTAVNLRFRISVRPASEEGFTIRMPDIGKNLHILPEEKIRYEDKRDYIRSAINILKRRGLNFTEPAEFIFQSDIPINSGMGSSSVMTVCWVCALLKLCGREEEPQEVARLAHEAEVLEFGEPGGMMDHYTASLGGLLHIDCGEKIIPTRLPAQLQGFVIGDSQEEKDTTGVLARSKDPVLWGIAELRRLEPELDFKNMPAGALLALLRRLPTELASKLEANVINRQLCNEALRMLRSTEVDYHELGRMLDQHHAQLRDALEVSTPKLEAMIRSAKEAGALGCKLNGSGGGGTMFALAPDAQRQVARAIEKAGGRAYIVSTDEGLRVQSPP